MPRAPDRWFRLATKLETAGWTLLPATAIWSITAGQVVAALLIAHWVARWRLPRAGPAWPPGLAGPMLVFLGWTVLAALAAGSPVSVSDGAGKWAFALLLPAAWSWARHGGDARRPLLGLVAGAVTVAPYAIGVFRSVAWGRAAAASGGPAHLGSSLMMGFAVFVALAAAASGRVRAAAAGAAAGFFALLVLTLNRAALLGATAAGALVCIRSRPMLIPLALGAAASGLAAFPESRVALRLRSGLQAETDETALERRHMWGAGLRMVRDRPLAGFAGRRAFMDAYETRYRLPGAREPRPGHVHNSYLQAAVLHGVPGAGLLGWWLAVLARLSHAAGRGSPPAGAVPYGAAAAPLLLAALANAGFDFVLADGQHALTWFALTGLVLGAAAPRRATAQTRASSGSAGRGRRRDAGS